VLISRSRDKACAEYSEVVSFAREFQTGESFMRELTDLSAREFARD